MKKKGYVSAKEIARFGNIVTKSLTGIPMEEELEISGLSLIPEDILILYTDGFWQNVNVSSIINLTIEEIQTKIGTQKNLMKDNFSYLKISL